MEELKKYEEPEMEIKKIDFTDILTSSVLSDRQENYPEGPNIEYGQELT